MRFLEFLSRFRTEYLDIFFRGVSYFGEITVLLPVLCIIYWCVNKSIAYKTLFSFFISGSFVQGAKIAFRIPRPWVINPDFKPVGSAIETATGYSFPSGHSQSASSVFLSFSLWAKNRFIRVFSYIIVALVIFSRMYLGVHTPKDVLVALLISTIVVVGINFFTDNYAFPRSTQNVLLFIAILYSLLLPAYAALLVYWDVSTWELVADSIVFAASLSGFAIGAYIENRFINFGTKCIFWWMQIVKIVLGIGGILGIKYLANLIPFSEMIQDSIGTFFICLWITCIFPIFIKLVQKKKYSEL